MTAIPPEHAELMRQQRKKGIALLVGLVVFLFAAFGLFLSPVGDFLNEFQASYSGGRYRPKFTAILCMVPAFALAFVCGLVTERVLGWSSR
jgi:hypothetical protein